MNEIIEKLLSEVDSDIREAMSAPSNEVQFNYPDKPPKYYPKWALLQDPANAILGWQAMRDRKPPKVGMKMS